MMIYRFGSYALDIRLYELRQAGIPLKLEPQVFDLLVYLIKHRDRVVTRQELFEHLWPTQFVSEGTLTHLIMEARKVLGDSGRAQRIIQTVHGRGYRFIIEVEEEGPDTSDRIAPVTSPSPDLLTEHHQDSLEQVSPLVRSVQDSVTSLILPSQHTVRHERGFTPFVNRERELALLHDCLSRVEVGQGQVVGIVGGPGIGKSRLLFEFRSQMTQKLVIYSEGHCLSYGHAIPYLPLRSLVRKLCGITGTDPPELSTTKLRRHCQERQMSIAEWLVPLQQLLGIPAGTEQWTMLSSEARKRRMFEALRHLIWRNSQHHPLILVVENLHWIDKTSADFLLSLVDDLIRTPVLFLSTYRPGYRPPWIRHSFVTQLSLQPLSHHESLRLVHSLCHKEQIPDLLLQEVFAKAEGNPFFLEELTYTVIAHEDVQPPLAVPDTIQEVIMTRIKRLSARHRRLLQIASGLGRRVSLRLLRMLWKSPDDLQELLGELRRLEFLYEQAGSDEPIYLFKHVLTQEVAYASMGLTAQQALHTAAGQALELLYANRLDEVLDQLAYHYTKSLEADKAVTYLTQLAAKATRSYAHAETVAALQEALVHVAKLPYLERERRFLDLLIRQAFSFSILGRFREIMDLLLPQQELVDRLQEPILAGPYYFRLGMTATYLGEQGQVVPHAQRALAAAQQCGDVATMGMSYYLLAFACYSAGQFRQGVDYGQQAIAYLQDTDQYHWLGLAYWMIGTNASVLGDFTMALEALTQARTIGEAMEDLRLPCFADAIAGWIYTLKGERDTGVTLCQRHLDHAPDPFTKAAIFAFLGAIYLEQGESTRAIPFLEQAIQLFQQFAYRSGQGRFLSILGEAFLVEEQLERAGHLALQGLEISREVQHPYGVGFAQRLLGRLAQIRGAFGEAQQHLSEALQIFTTSEARFETGKTHLALAELAHAQGHGELFRWNLEEAHRLFTDLQLSQYISRTENLAGTG